jgi:hypothetical protein
MLPNALAASNFNNFVDLRRVFPYKGDTLFFLEIAMLAAILLVFSQNPALVVSLPFIKADTVCTNKQNESDRTLFTAKCLDRMAKNYKPVKIYYAMYSSDGKEELAPLGVVSCIYVTKDQIFARCEFDVKPPKDIKEYILNAKTSASKNDYYVNTSCIVEISNADIKAFVLRTKDKAITFE